MLSYIIEVCARNRFLVFTAVLLLTLAGIWSLQHVPLDALPDISDVQVIVHTNWAGQPPDVIEDQVTYPIVTSMLAAPHVKAVRAQTMFGDSYVYIVFQDGTDLYWARSRVIEYLQQISGRLPEGVHPVIGPDATGAGWVYEYAIVDKSHRHSLADLRSLQDWHLRYALETVPGVAEVASIGGYVKQYQVQLDPNKLLAYGIPLSTVIDRVKASTNEVGGRLLDLSGAEYMIRGLGYLRSLDDLALVAVGSKNGTPVLLRDLGTVSFGPDIREGVAEWNGEGETVGGIIVMRQGMNALNVINGVKTKLREIAPSLPPGVEIMSGYDRSGLIRSSIQTLQRDLLEEAIIVSLVIILFLFHFRSALIAILALPIAVVVSFIPMYLLGVTSNIMSLGGIALAIGVLVDASIVMVENGYRHLSERQQNGTQVSEPERRTILINAAKQVGPALFFSLLIIVVSFLPVFLLEAQEGRMFRPLAWTKTLAVGSSSILAITLVPVLMVMLIRGRLRPESANPISRVTQAIYLPILRFCLRYRWLTIAANVLFLVIVLPLGLHLGSQFMPPLYEGSTLYMPTALPGISIGQAEVLLQEQDRILRSFPEVVSVFGTVGRSDSATDNAPLDMYDTTLMLKPREQWPAGMTYGKLIQQMDAKLQFPGLTNTWTSPVENRLDMELTGIKTPLGLKVQGTSVEGIQQVASQIETILSTLPQVRSTFAEKVAQGFYVNVEVNRAEAARYGLTVADVQTAVSSGIGGKNIAENIEGRERYPINVRYQRDFRDDVEQMRGVLIATPTGAQIPLGQVAAISFSRGPAMIRDEDGALTGYVYIDLKNANYGGFVAEANNQIQQKLKLPAGYTYQWSGEYQFEQRAKQRLKLILPVVFAVIFLLLYLVFHSVAEALVLIFPTIYAMTGGLLLQWLLHYNFSVAVAVGYIALFGIAVETGVVMVVYLHEALEKRIESNHQMTNADIEAAAIEGAVQRLRPKLMTVCAVLASLAPILWESGIGSDVMKPIAAPIVGGMITSTIHVLILVPVFFVMMKERELRRGTLLANQDNQTTSHL
ncbi:MAG: cation transporter [Acidobacteriales bacterium 59-55]|jgi:Cu(I)/Ag(I) efflux system membrane protein CusA/SilA|uniref:Cu(I)/Ag(I) efflux system membrane protein CusA/SilA n=1 Tax=Acidipila rosea TaxID=768535 RepID=A0A4R1L462_9BACT|nr:CusA/CzcA family heavy metal efflux RND transporter [Acidipila rosea]MBN9614804.1 efflux RND transporter permease subunit [Terriglobales bacterium]OJV40327.1 MAG: cation transporter [Acidobacteriales bacterium 59-55]TCK72866.1 Cu(I)/Ag(I) efflux system membrane protein CusA/SilA [Acidipila rosea]HZY62809.1 CusA/CzcA family heavy metal efflux RND transporter [Edaphobacter sp.]